MNRPGELGVIFAVFRLTSEMPVVRAFTGMDVPAGQFPVTGVTPAHQQDPPGDVADCRERGRCHTGGGGGVRLMVILAADARAPGPASLPAGPGQLGPRPVASTAQRSHPDHGDATPGRRRTHQDDRRNPRSPASSRNPQHSSSSTKVLGSGCRKSAH